MPKTTKKTTIEIAHMRFCKDLLGVQKQTSNVGVLLELGEVPLSVLAQNNCMKNFSRITLAKQANNLLQILAHCNYTNYSWFYITQPCLNATGVENSDEKIRNCLLQRLIDIFH